MTDLRFRVEVADGVLVKELEGEAVLLDLASETYFGLNRTAFRMWSALTSHVSIGAALHTLTVEYDVEPEVLERDAMALVERLEREGLLRIVGA